MLNFEELVKGLEGRGEAELRALHADAIRAEAEAKAELVKVRQWVANLATDANVEEEKALAEAKAVLADATTWLKAIESRLGGHPASPTAN